MNQTKLNQYLLVESHVTEICACCNTDLLRIHSLYVLFY
jgi:hypothetical protein